MPRRALASYRSSNSLNAVGFVLAESRSPREHADVPAAVVVGAAFTWTRDRRRNLGHGRPAQDAVVAADRVVRADLNQDPDRRTHCATLGGCGEPIAADDRQWLV